MSQIADFVAYSPDGQIALIAEAKGRTNTSRSWATQMRRNMLAHGTVPNSRFFLLALPDRLYLWKDAGNTSELVEPTYEIDATPFFQPYSAAARVSPDRLTGRKLRIDRHFWLNELVRSGLPEDVPEPQRHCFRNRVCSMQSRVEASRLKLPMNVYVETNFILELAFVQDEHESAIGSWNYVKPGVRRSCSRVLLCRIIRNA